MTCLTTVTVLLLSCQLSLSLPVNTEEGTAFEDTQGRTFGLLKGIALGLQEEMASLNKFQAPANQGGSAVGDSQGGAAVGASKGGTGDLASRRDYGKSGCPGGCVGGGVYPGGFGSNQYQQVIIDGSRGGQAIPSAPVVSPVVSQGVVPILSVAPGQGPYYGR